MSCVLTGVVPLGLVLLLCGAQGFFLPNVTHLEKLLSKYHQDQPHLRARRAISRTDREEILMLHNKLRGQVSPPASNMEYMVSSGPGAGLAWGLGAGAGEGHRLGSGLGAHLAVGGTPSTDTQPWGCDGTVASVQRGLHPTLQVLPLST